MPGENTKDNNSIQSYHIPGSSKEKMTDKPLIPEPSSTAASKTGSENATRKHCTQRKRSLSEEMQTYNSGHSSGIDSQSRTKDDSLLSKNTRKVSSRQDSSFNQHQRLIDWKSIEKLLIPLANSNEYNSTRKRTYSNSDNHINGASNGTTTHSLDSNRSDNGHRKKFRNENNSDGSSHRSSDSETENISPSRETRTIPNNEIHIDVSDKSENKTGGVYGKVIPDCRSNNANNDDTDILKRLLMDASNRNKSKLNQTADISRDTYRKEYQSSASRTQNESLYRNAGRDNSNDNRKLVHNLLSGDCYHLEVLLNKFEYLMVSILKDLVPAMEFPVQKWCNCLESKQKNLSKIGREKKSISVACQTNETHSPTLYKDETVENSLYSPPSNTASNSQYGLSFNMVNPNTHSDLSVNKNNSQEGAMHNLPGRAAGTKQFQESMPDNLMPEKKHGVFTAGMMPRNFPTQRTPETLMPGLMPGALTAGMTPQTFIPVFTAGGYLAGMVSGAVLPGGGFGPNYSSNMGGDKSEKSHTESNSGVSGMDMTTGASEKGTETGAAAIRGISTDSGLGTKSCVSNEGTTSCDPAVVTASSVPDMAIAVDESASDVSVVESNAGTTSTTSGTETPHVTSDVVTPQVVPCSGSKGDACVSEVKSSTSVSETTPSTSVWEPQPDTSDVGPKLEISDMALLPATPIMHSVLATQLESMGELSKNISCFEPTKYR